VSGLVPVAWERASGPRVFALAVALVATGALAQQRYDHRGSIGATAGLGGEVLASTAVGGLGDNGVRMPMELAGTISITDRTEGRAAVRLALFGPRLAWSAYAGVRSSFGYEKWKTFFDLDFAAHFAPVWTLGARVAVGVQYDFLPVMGVFSTLGGQLGGGAGLRLSFELMAGVQFRTYVLE
jgi:hypothetical protein